MERVKRQHLAEQVVQYYKNVANFDKFKTVSHFREQGYKRSGLYSIIKRFEERGSAQFRPLSGRPVTVATKIMCNKVKKCLINTNKSISETARALQITRGSVINIKRKLGIKTKKCQKIPKYSKTQERRAKTNCRKIYRRSIGKVVIFDDETYCKVDPKANYGTQSYHFIDENKVPNSVRFQGIEKFPKKYLIWQAMDEFGNISEPYIKVGSMNSEEYRVECIERRLMPFINKYHKSKQVLFWPDMARIHYGKVVKEFLESHNIEYVEWDNNAPAVPQARPIEEFWSNCKRIYSKNRKVPKNLSSFIKVWKDITDYVSNNFAQALTDDFRKVLKNIGDKGVYASFKK